MKTVTSNKNKNKNKMNFFNKRLTESQIQRVVKLVLNEGKQWVAQSSYNIGRTGFDQVLNKGSVFNSVQGMAGVSAMCVNDPFSQDDPLYFSCTASPKLYEMTFGSKVEYFNQQLVIALSGAFCQTTKIGGSGTNTGGGSTNTGGGGTKLPPNLMPPVVFSRLYTGLLNGKSGVKAGGSGNNQFLYAGMWVIWRNMNRNNKYFITTGKGPSTQLFKLAGPFLMQDLPNTKLISKDGKSAVLSDVIPGLVKATTNTGSKIGEKLKQGTGMSTATTTKSTTAAPVTTKTTTKTPVTTKTTTKTPVTTTATTKAPETGTPTNVVGQEKQLEETKYNFKKLLESKSGNIKPLLDR